ncbi:LysR family transcriptional regulator [Pseudoteredinibacter isoporae]|uniref:LysR family transcriptional regulator n=1 Tax=Pseudoteredinibacter isoporae TaxID=570281 RepID=UPI003105531A
MDQLKALRYFIKVAETGSFTLASTHFSVPPSSLSRRIADLEKHLGADLLIRTTRTVKLTEIGAEYYQQVSEIVKQLTLSDETVKNYQNQVMGTLKISSLVGFGEAILLPLLDEFKDQHPMVTLDVHLSDNLVMLGKDDVDIAIRGGYAPNERVVAVKLMNNHFIPVASPQYLQKHGHPRHPQDLKTHRGLYYRNLEGPIPWLTQSDGQWQEVSAPADTISNSGEWLIKKATEGKGILMLPYWTIERELRSGKLTKLNIEPPLTNSSNENFAIYLLYQRQRYHIPKIRALVDFLSQRLGRPA